MRNARTRKIINPGDFFYTDVATINRLFLEVKQVYRVSVRVKFRVIHRVVFCELGEGEEGRTVVDQSLFHMS